MKKSDFKIVFFGTPDFAVESLRAIHEAGYDVAAVVTAPDKPAGRGRAIQQPAVKKYAVEAGIPVLQPVRLKDPEFVETLRGIGARLFVIIAFRMLPEVVWTMPELGTFNLHASLLPKFRGAAPINHAIIQGEKETGVTTFFLQHEIDTGDIIMQRQISIGEDENVGSLHDRLMALGAEVTVATAKAIADGTVTTHPQPEGEFTPAPKIFKETCRIDWRKSAREIHNFVRGLSPYPAAWSTLREKSGKPIDVKIFAVKPVSKDSYPDAVKSLFETLKPGECSISAKGLYAGAGCGEILEIIELQPAGKKRMEASAFILGYTPDKFDCE